MKRNSINCQKLKRVILTSITTIMFTMSSLQYAKAETTDCDTSDEMIEENALSDSFDMPETQSQSDNENISDSTSIYLNSLEETTYNNYTDADSYYDENDSDIQTASNDITDGSGFHYRLLSDNSYAVTDYTGYSTSITIPYCTGSGSTYHDVTVIDDNFLNGKSKSTSITSVTIPSDIIKIGANAFKGCTNLTNVTFESEYHKGMYAALDYYTTNLESIGDSAFYGCTKLSTIRLSAEGLTTIGANAFSGCTSLSRIDLPRTLLSIGSNAFLSCNSLSTLYYDGDISNWLGISYGEGSASHPNYYATNIYFSKRYINEDKWGYEEKDSQVILKTLEINSGFSNIPAYAFYNFKNITTITLSSVSTVGSYAFANCSSLKNVTLGNSVGSLGEYAFYNDNQLISIDFGNSITKLNAYTFGNCTNLNGITIPKSINAIDTNAFNNCTKLSTVYVYNNTYGYTFFKTEYNYSTPSHEVIIKDSDSPVSTKTELVGCSASFDGNIAMNFYFNITDSDIKSGVRVSTTIPKGNGTYSTSNRTMTSSSKKVNGYYVVSVTILPQYADEKITATISTNNNSEKYEISYLNYCKKIIENSNNYTNGNETPSVTLTKALLTYCDSIQRYFGYHAGSIPSNLLVSESSLLSYADNLKAYNNDFTNTDFAGCSLVINTTVTFRMYFTGEYNNNAIYIGNSSVSPSQVNGIYYYSVTGFYFGKDSSQSKYMGQPITIKSSNGTQNINAVYTYLSLAMQSSNNSLKYLASSIYYLNEQAQNYALTYSLAK